MLGLGSFTAAPAHKAFQARKKSVLGTSFTFNEAPGALPRSWEQIFKFDFAAEVRKKKRPSGPDQHLCHKLRGGRGFLKSLLRSKSSGFT